MFNKILIIVLAMYVVAAFEPGHAKESYIFGKFQEFLTKENKKYTTIEEYLARFQIFKANYEKLEAFHMNRDEETLHSQGINKFFDMTPQEFRRTHLNLKISVLDTLKSKSEHFTFSENKAPESHDWRKEGAVGPVKDQGNCGSCWAFSSVGNLEGLNYLKTKKMVQFSEQQLVDCDHNGDQGCNGGLMKNAFDYLTTAGGLETESDYKYKGQDGTCEFVKSKAAVKVNGSTMASQDEAEIKEFLFATGPLAIALNADPLQFYNGGIIDADAASCDPQGLNHGVTLVGYGSENGHDFWIVKNSWGTGWGEQGFFRMARGKGTCGINTYVISAKLA
jgi:cathepsin F